MTNTEALEKTLGELYAAQLAYDNLASKLKTLRNISPENKTEISGLENLCWNMGIKIKLLKRMRMYYGNMTEYYPDIYYSKRHTGMRRWEKKLGYYMADLFSVQSMIDFGCALGSYMEGVIEYGADPVDGIEILYEKALPYIPEEIKNRISQGDIGQPMQFKRKYDCSFSIEVAEHLPEELADNFVDNLIKSSSRLIVVSASNRGGHYHINQKQKDYWIGKFAIKGCRYSSDDTERLINIWKSKGCPGYIQHNLMVFWTEKYA